MSDPYEEMQKQPLWSDGKSVEDIERLAEEDSDVVIYNLHEDVCCLKEDKTQLEQEVKELKAHVEHQRNELNTMYDVAIDGGMCAEFMRVNFANTQTPKQSLAQHDKEVAINAINDACHWLMYEYKSGLNTRQIEDALDAYVEQLQQGEGNDT